MSLCGTVHKTKAEDLSARAVEIVHLLLRHVNRSANGNYLTKSTALLIACKHVAPSVIIECLLVEDCDVNAKYDDDNTALHKLAAGDIKHSSSDAMALAKILLAAGARVDARNRYGVTPLLKAAENDGNFDMIRLLLDNGADVNAYDNNKRTPLQMAVLTNRDIRAIEELLKRGANVNARRNGRTVLHDAVRKAIPTPVVELLLDHGAEINATIDDGDYSPLHLAVINACEDVERGTETVQLLLNRGAAVDAIDNYGRTPLHMIVDVNGNFTLGVQIARLLATARANVSVADNRGRTPATLLLENIYENSHPLVPFPNSGVDQREVIGELCTVFAVNGACLNIATEYGVTFGHLAAFHDNVNLLELFLSHGGDINASTPELGTPLREAVTVGSYCVLERLIQLGAHLDAGFCGKTVFRDLLLRCDAGHQCLYSASTSLRL